MDNKHPIYGPFTRNEWIPLFIKSETNINILVPNYKIMITDSFCRIINSSTMTELTPYKNTYTIVFNDNNLKINALSLMLSSAFPNIETNETVDHIDDNPDNNFIRNLQWMSNVDNCKKGQIKSVQSSKENGGKNGRYVIIKKPDSTYPKDLSKLVSIGTFKSIRLTADFLKETLKKDISNKSLESKITRAINNPQRTVYGFHFEAFNNDLEDEEWKPLVFEEKTYMVSNYGRVKNSFGHYSVPYQNRLNTKYTSVIINGSYKYIHRLVWQAFNGEIPTDKEILHDDTAPLNENGSYRNYLKDLRIGTRSENMKEFHANKTNNVIITNEQPFTPFIEKTPEISSLGLKPAPETAIQKLMANPPKYIQYIRATEKRGSKFVIGRQCPGATTDISSSGSKAISDEDKFKQIIERYDQLMGTNYLAECKE